MNDLDKMNLIAIVQQLPKDDIDFIETYISIMEEKIDRLNNIINELEQWLKEHSIIDYNCSDVILHEQMALNTAFEYLQILKESKQ